MQEGDGHATRGGGQVIGVVPRGGWVLGAPCGRCDSRRKWRSMATRSVACRRPAGVCSEALGSGTARWHGACFRGEVEPQDLGIDSRMGNGYQGGYGCAP
jgi:hypothetical protein